MRKKLLFCIISIFLCAPFSTSGKSPEQLALECERVVFEGGALEEINAALMLKANCYKELGRYEDAYLTLERVRMYALDPLEQQDVLYNEQLCAFLSGDFTRACALAEEVSPWNEETLLIDALSYCYAGNYEKAEHYAAVYMRFIGKDSREVRDFFRDAPKRKNSTTAMILSFLPPAGHFYTGEYGEGMLSMGLNAAAAAFTALNLAYGYWITGFVGGGIALDHTFMGNQERTAALVERYNTNSAIAFGDSLKAFFAAQ